MSSCLAFAPGRGVTASHHPHTCRRRSAPTTQAIRTRHPPIKVVTPVTVNPLRLDGRRPRPGVTTSSMSRARSLVVLRAANDADADGRGGGSAGGSRSQEDDTPFEDKNSNDANVLSFGFPTPSPSASFMDVDPALDAEINALAAARDKVGLGHFSPREHCNQSDTRERE
jgi:hypothetical protein